MLFLPDQLDGDIFMNIRFSPRTLLSVLALSLGLVASTYAMPRGEHPGPGMSMHGGHHTMIHGRAMARLHDELKLDAKQDALWKDADKFSQEHRDSMRDRIRKQHDEVKAQLDQPGADLRAVAKRMDELKADGQKQATAVRERWLSVYDALNPEQKEKARLFFKSGFERMERMGQRGAERRGHGQPPRDLPPSPAPKS